MKPTLFDCPKGHVLVMLRAPKGLRWVTWPVDGAACPEHRLFAGRRGRVKRPQRRFDW
jgi:hypothetical protein